MPALPNGFIPWHGGNNPLPGGRCYVVWRGSNVPAAKIYEADKLDWSRNQPTNQGPMPRIMGFMPVPDGKP